MMKVMTGLCVSILLMVHAVSDSKDRTIWWPLSAAAVVPAYVINCCIRQQSVISFVMGLVPAAALCLLCLLPMNTMGLGDAAVIAGCGAFLGWTDTWMLVIPAFVLAGIYSLLLLLRKKAVKETQIPFVPFLLLSWIFHLAGELLVYIS